MKTKQNNFFKYNFIILTLFFLLLPFSSLANQNRGIQFTNNLIKKNSKSNKEKDDKYYLEAGILKYAKSKGMEALQDFFKAIEKNPKNYEAYFWRGSIFRDLACKDIQKAADLGQDTAKKELKRICSYIISGQDELKVYMDDAFKKLMDRDLKGALESYNLAINLNSDYARAYQFRGSVYFEMGKDKLALRDLNKSIELAPKESSALLFRGLIKYGSNDVKGACKDFKASYDLGNNNAVKEFNEKCPNISY